MTINESREGESLVLTIQGKIDTVTTPQVQTAILTGFQKASAVIIDCEGVEYISSAGLRAFLIGQKTAASKGGTLTVRHMSEGVLAVFKTTGFDKVLNII